MHRFAALSIFVFIAPALPAQETGAPAAVPQRQQVAGSITMGFPGGGMKIGPPVTGMPYSAERVTETVQTLADGTHIRQNRRSELIYRDSLGRTRTESSPGGPAAEGVKIVRITDAVGGYEYTLDQTNQVAHRVAVQVMQPMASRLSRTPAPNASVTPALVQRVVPATGVGAGVAGSAAQVAAVRAAGTAGGRPRPEMQSEDLGTQVIEGITARGRRTTETWAVNSIGNDRPIVVVRDTWFSDQLGGMMVLSKSNDPRYGESTTALKNFSLSEPDPALFQPPAGYQIVDENGPFRITVPPAQR